MHPTDKSRVESSTTARGPALPDRSTGLEVIVQWIYPGAQYVAGRGETR
jgi:hypothetical protein